MVRTGMGVNHCFKSTSFQSPDSQTQRRLVCETCSWCSTAPKHNTSPPACSLLTHTRQESLCLLCHRPQLHIMELKPSRRAVGICFFPEDACPHIRCLKHTAKNIMLLFTLSQLWFCNTWFLCPMAVSQQRSTSHGVQWATTSVSGEFWLIIYSIKGSQMWHAILGKHRETHARIVEQFPKGFLLKVHSILFCGYSSKPRYRGATLCQLFVSYMQTYSLLLCPPKFLPRISPMDPIKHSQLILGSYSQAAAFYLRQNTEEEKLRLDGVAT